MERDEQSAGPVPNSASQDAESSSDGVADHRTRGSVSLADAQSQPGASWWTRPCGGRDVLRLALPLIFSTASWTVMHFIDRLFLTWLSTAAIAAAMPAGMLHFTAICLPMEMARYVTTFVAQYFGANRLQRVGPVVWHGLLLGLFTIPVFALMMGQSELIFRLSGHPPEIQHLEAVYFRALGYGAPAAVLSAALASFYTGIGRPSVVMVVDSLAALLNIGLDYFLIFGGWGIEGYGIAGAGWATSIAQWFKVVVYLSLMMRSDRACYGLFSSFRFDRALFGRLIWFGGPSGIQIFVEVAAFTAFAMMMGQLGELSMAATTIAFSVNSMAFVPMIGLGIAVSTLVGHQLGAGRPDMAERAAWTSTILGIGYTSAFGVAFLVVPDWFLFAHAAGSGELAEVAEICRVLLRFVAAYCVFDMLQIVFSSVIKGAGDTRFVLLATAMISPIPVGLAWLGIRQWRWQLTDYWWVVTIWIWVLAMVYFLRFLRGPWRRMTVIESREDSPQPNDPVANLPTEARTAEQAAP